MKISEWGAEGSIIRDLDGEFKKWLVSGSLPMISGLHNPILKRKVQDHSKNRFKAVKEKMKVGS